MTLVAEILIVFGAGWSLLAGIGMNRFGDVYARMHVATKSTTLGVLMVLVGSAMQLPTGAAAKLMLAAVLLLLTAPIGAHLVGRSVHHHTGTAEVRIDTVNELAAAEQEERVGNGDATDGGEEPDG